MISIPFSLPPREEKEQTSRLMKLPFSGVNSCSGRVQQWKLEPQRSTRVLRKQMAKTHGEFTQCDFKHHSQKEKKKVWIIVHTSLSQSRTCRYRLYRCISKANWFKTKHKVTLRLKFSSFVLLNKQLYNVGCGSRGSILKFKVCHISF